MSDVDKFYAFLNAVRRLGVEHGIEVLPGHPVPDPSTPNVILWAPCTFTLYEKEEAPAPDLGVHIIDGGQVQDRVGG